MILILVVQQMIFVCTNSICCCIFRLMIKVLDMGFVDYSVGFVPF